MKVTNKIPASFIVAETKINPQSVNSAMKAACGKKDWADDHHRRNLNAKLSDLEILPELAGVLAGIEPDSTEEFNHKYAGYLDGWHKHSTMTVVFAHVSTDFMNRIIRMNLAHTNCSEIDPEEMSFWVNPVLMEDKHAQLFFGKEMMRTGEVIINLDEFMEKNDKGTQKERIEAARRLLPAAAQINMITTANLSDWREIVYRGSQFNQTAEVRYVLLDLARRFKMKYPSVFYDLCLEDTEGGQYGMDTLSSSEDAWRTLRVAHKKPQE